MARDCKVELTETEWAIMKEVWRAEPRTAPDVQEALHRSRGWSYSTVRTLMDRMAVKGFLTTERIRRLTLYRARVTQEQARRGEVQYALKHAFNGALTPMVQCLLEVNEFDAGELQELERLLRDWKRKPKD